MDQLSDYDYELPAELIASHPLPQRDASRLLVVDRERQRLEHRSIADLPEFLQPGDSLVVNDTRVLPARLIGQRTATGGRWEGLFLNTTTDGDWRLMGQTRGRLQIGETVTVNPIHPDRATDDAQLVLTLMERADDGVQIWHAESDESAITLLNRFGTMPLPPYMQRKTADSSDFERYQTVYAQHAGSVAAPTAGLHLTDELRQRCQQAKIGWEQVTLHVGIGTFRPIKTERLDEHVMHREWCAIDEATAKRLQAVRDANKRVAAVGTTSVRTLETAAANGTIQAFEGETDLFLRPGSEFHAVDILLTNFHLPRSSLLVLVSALAGRELIREAYKEAIRERYRFFSYGDAMLIL
ncbi:tRNA preQ1(34) S-adenosylmethionine ribosyltransferase-isomerase QueA [Thalassoroseus pseudoceratinae]|uniref:tRNA preQ1(34) S-adenosylmethionine ribosyltransferase-isomerase QueA n=1 Tax=Thalassoroseus pseudoceratinae TaxID=2713176 RepID=UPI00141EF5E8|nr:tRNA preQ1(34) S-adenosylmethionine ribosyltransferase-isomerase QueA [Thalassoroseus pseudoceratinae]